MAVNINTVYQKVLAIANKEKRGYITPQEFNLFADQAQKEIFEQYFYDLNQFKRVPGNDTVSSDPTDIIEEKISLFRKQSTSSTLSDEIYRLESVRYKDSITDTFYTAEEVSKKEHDALVLSKLTRPTITRPIFYRLENQIYRFPDSGYSDTLLDYIKKPTTPSWAYNIINQKPFYNSTNSIDFELHHSDESELVYRILFMAGVAIEKPQLSQAAAALQTSTIQQEKQ